ncbi:hypothetical protein [Helicobacter himalayensis]|nr:hypothetical protein [Helicobacter himalayensis]
MSEAKYLGFLDFINLYYLAGANPDLALLARGLDVFVVDWNLRFCNAIW